MAEAYTISVSNDDHAEEHSRRSYTPGSADRSLQSQNVVIYDCGDDRKHFNDFFRPAIEAYNAKQTRADRKKSLDYFSALQNGTEGYGRGKAKEKPIYHDVIQIGNRETNGITTDAFDVDRWRAMKKAGDFEGASAYAKSHLNKSKDAADMKEILERLAEEIRDNKDGRYNGILVHGLIIHADEPNGTAHLDFRYTIYTTGEKTGLGSRVSMTKGLAGLGYKTTPEQTALEQFRNQIKNRLEELMTEYGYQREVKDEHRKHQPTAVYEMEQRAKKAQETVAALDARAASVATAEQDLAEEQKKNEDLKKRLKDAVDKHNARVEKINKRQDKVIQRSIELGGLGEQLKAKEVLLEEQQKQLEADRESFAAQQKESADELGKQAQALTEEHQKVQEQAQGLDEILNPEQAFERAAGVVMQLQKMAPSPKDKSACGDVLLAMKKVKKQSNAKEVIEYATKPVTGVWEEAARQQREAIAASERRIAEIVARTLPGEMEDEDSLDLPRR